MATQYEDDKASIRQIESGLAPTKEDNHVVDRHLQVELPASLVGLSAEEIAKVDRQATKKLDILLMPTLVSLYILYVSLVQCQS